MEAAATVAEFSRNRLGGEPVPRDLQILLAHREELAERTELGLNASPGWAPWLDTSYLSPAERANPDIAANVRAIAEVCQHVAFVAASEEGEYLGYWRGPAGRPVAQSPLVWLDNEGQFNLCPGTTFAEAVLSRADDAFEELRDWFQSIGIPVDADGPDDLAAPTDAQPPDRLHSELYRRYRG